MLLGIDYFRNAKAGVYPNQKLIKFPEKNVNIPNEKVSMKINETLISETKQGLQNMNLDENNDSLEENKCESSDDKKIVKKKSRIKIGNNSSKMLINDKIGNNKKKNNNEIILLIAIAMLIINIPWKLTNINSTEKSKQIEAIMYSQAFSCNTFLKLMLIITTLIAIFGINLKVSNLKYNNKETMNIELDKLNVKYEKTSNTKKLINSNVKKGQNDGKQYNAIVKKNFNDAKEYLRGRK